jgi:hypothetical protein
MSTSEASVGRLLFVADAVADVHDLPPDARAPQRGR